MKKINTKGFTLVELLAVIMVLAIIMGIAIQSVQRIIKNNRRDSFVSSVDMVVEAAETACMQDGSYNNVPSYIEGDYSNGNDDIIIYTTKNNGEAYLIRVRARAGGNYEDLTWADVKDKFDGKPYDIQNYWSVTADPDGTRSRVYVKIPYSCETE